MFRINENTININGLKKSYKLMVITDTHFTLFGKDETPARATYAAPRVPHFADHVTGRPPYTCVEEYIDFANNNGFDAVLFAGDIIDFPSKENIDMMRNLLAKLKVPYLYVPGNHDWSYFDNYHTADSIKNELPLFNEFCNGDTSFQKLKIGELTFCGLDNTTDRFREGIYEKVENTLKTEENVIFIQHVPFSSPELVDDTIRVWKRNITLGGEGICNDDSADKMRDLICSYGSSKAVIAGHLHDVVRRDLLCGKVPQLIAEISCYGVATVVYVQGE